MGEFVVTVMLGYFTGCWGPVVAMKPDPDEPRYLYLVRLTCVGPHNDTHDHERTFKFTEWLPASSLQPRSKDE